MPTCSRFGNEVSRNCWSCGKIRSPALQRDIARIGVPCFVSAPLLVVGLVGCF